MSDNHYDAIVIGSGIGGLTVASVLAQKKGMKVLVLERHYRAGGFTHEFSRKNFHWEVGVHYVGDMAEGKIMRRLFDIVTAGQVRWERMHEPFEKFVYPDFTFSVFGSEERYFADLVAQFPAEAGAVRKYLADVKRAAAWFVQNAFMKPLLPFFNTLGVPSLGLDSPLLRTGDYLKTHFKDEKLRALLASQWGDYGLPPAESAFIIHALIVSHYLDGGYFPVGGAGGIAAAVTAVINRSGGAVLVSHEVTEVIVEGGIAVGVRAQRLPAGSDAAREFRAPLVISDAGAYTTFLKLVPEAVPLTLRDSLRSFYRGAPVMTNVTLYLGLKDDPRKLGCRGENYWFFSSYDHDTGFARRHNWISSGVVPGAYLSFPSLKNPESKSHTAEIIAATDYSAFAHWQDTPWKRRGPEYEALKEKVSQALIAFVDERLPGFAAGIQFHELSTPITNQHFTNHPQGAMYGLPCVPERFGAESQAFCRAKTPIDGLFLTGADVFSPGVAGALMGGFSCLSEILGGFTVRSMMRGSKPA